MDDTNKHVWTWPDWAAFAAVTVLLLLAMPIAFHLSDRREKAQPPDAGKIPASPPTFQTVERKVPMAVFESTAGLKIGVKIQVTVDGQDHVGTLKAIGKDDVTVEFRRP